MRTSQANTGPRALLWVAILLVATLISVLLLTEHLLNDARAVIGVRVASISYLMRRHPDLYLSRLRSALLASAYELRGMIEAGTVVSPGRVPSGLLDSQHYDVRAFREHGVPLPGRPHGAIPHFLYVVSVEDRLYLVTPVFGFDGAALERRGYVLDEQALRSMLYDPTIGQGVARPGLLASAIR